MAEKGNRRDVPASNDNTAAADRPRRKVTAIHATGAPAFVTIAAPATFFALPLAGAVMPGTPLDTRADAASPLDLAATCCWMGWPTTSCAKPNACANGDQYCESPHFSYSNGFHDGRMVCSDGISTRGEAAAALTADPAPRLFMAPRGVDLSPDTVARLRTVTAVTRLQYLAAMEPELAEKKYADPRGALAELGIAIPEEMQVSIVRDEASGEDVVSVEGFGRSEELRYAADGTRIEAEADAAE